MHFWITFLENSKSSCRLGMTCYSYIMQKETGGNTCSRNFIYFWIWNGIIQFMIVHKGTINRRVYIIPTMCSQWVKCWVCTQLYSWSHKWRTGKWRYTWCSLKHGKEHITRTTRSLPKGFCYIHIYPVNPLRLDIYFNSKIKLKDESKPLPW